MMTFLLQMIQVPQRGPGCQHFLTCAMCLTAPKFMGCGWCSGACSWEDECERGWRNESCPPGISGVSLRSSTLIFAEPKLGHSLLTCLPTVLPADRSP